jgi:hypothetical protein
MPPARRGLGSLYGERETWNLTGVRRASYVS